MTVVVSRMDAQTQSLIKSSKRKLKKRMAELGLSTIKHKIESANCVEIGPQSLTGNLSIVAEMVAKRNPFIAKEIVEGYEEYKRWSEQWMSYEERNDIRKNYFYLSKDGSGIALGLSYSIPFGGLSNAKPCAIEEIQWFNEIIVKHLDEAEYNEFQLKRIFSPEKINSKENVKRNLCDLRDKKGEKLKILQIALKKEIVKIVTEYKEEIRNIKMQTS